ncbi:helix-turn-helix transcriptional regulator [Simiduia curdlanivorans]|uniref:Helix-turn-helix transcriptional regulator n=1 Tax=Simiduia curdlanivorans TaxID=1492769 RepID=A0ABV8V7R1_9GAMM|nr:helix-turn-helix transcriptional regulator [Simiduia curdlanivorans]MDN3639721.1 helix-turn-helix transcriptional regulator [Simiduia curdlanivorans]
MPTQALIEEPIRTPTWSGGEIDLLNLLLPGVVGFAISQVLLAMLLIALSPKQSLQQGLYSLLLLTLLGFFLAPFAADGPWSIVAITLMTGIPGVFWLFSASLFDDHFSLKTWQISLVLMTVCLPLVDLLASQIGIIPAPFWVTILVDAPAVLELLLVGLAVAVIARNWRVDLVESRRDLRLWLCGVNAAYLFIILIMREVLYAYFPWLNYAQYVIAALVLLITNVMLLRPNAGLLTPDSQRYRLPRPHLPQSDHKQSPKASTDDAPIQQDTNTHIDPIDETTLSENFVAEKAPRTNEAPTEVPAEVLQQIHALMDNEHIYQDMELTMGQLAYRLKLQEYRLRKIINSGLGYRNFNDFLNSYRISEAAQRLSNTKEANIPITTIALDVGFRSISTFNKAFKSHFDTTPTAFRRTQLTTSNEN